MLYRDPCVFIVDRQYQIIFNTLEYGIAWVDIGGRQYRDSEGGLMRSETLVHRVNVPMEALDTAREYTVCFRALPERRSYFPDLGDLNKRTYAFRPVDFSDGLQISMLSDTHSHIEIPSKAAEYFGDKLDLLFMVGDIPAESKQMSDLMAIYDILGNVTGGHIPVVFARGNHDFRGKYALDLTKYIGTRNGHTYFTFRVGSLWGIVLDCGEDKDDSHEEYGGVVDCHAMRMDETAFLQSVIGNAQNEYLAPGVETRVCLCHIPFPSRLMDEVEPIFNIEQDIYSRWVGMLNEMRLNAMLCGHMHKLSVSTAAEHRLRMGAQFPVIAAAAPAFDSADAPQFFSGAIEIMDGKMSVRAADENHQSKLLWQE